MNQFMLKSDQKNDLQLQFALVYKIVHVLKSNLFFELFFLFEIHFLPL